MYHLGFVKYDGQLIKKAGMQLCVKIFSRAKLTKLKMFSPVHLLTSTRLLQ